MMSIFVTSIFSAAAALKLSDCVIERDHALHAVADYQDFATLNALVTTIRAERGQSTAFVILEGKDKETADGLEDTRNACDIALADLDVWPSGLVVNGVSRIKVEITVSYITLKGKQSNNTVELAIESCRSR